MHQITRGTVLVLLVITSGLLLVPPRVAASCGDLDNEYLARQYFAPLIVELDFVVTPHRGGDWTSSRLAAANNTGARNNARFTIGDNYLRFEAYGNDTYSFWMAGFYDNPPAQNVTLHITEGDRVPAVEQFCMAASNFYFKWTDITVVQEPHPLSQSEVANAIYPELTYGLTQVMLGVNSVLGLVWDELYIIGAICVAIAILFIAVYRLGKKFRYG